MRLASNCSAAIGKFSLAPAAVLRSQAFTNRLNLGRSIGGVIGQTASGGLGLAGIGTSFPGFNAGFTETTSSKFGSGQFLLAALGAGGDVAAGFASRPG